MLIHSTDLTLCDIMDCSLPGTSVHGDSPGKNAVVGCHGLLQGIFPTQGLHPGLCTAGGFFTIWATREAPRGSNEPWSRWQQSCIPLWRLQDNRMYIFPLPTSRNFLHSLTYTRFSFQMRTSCQIFLRILHSVPLFYLYLLPRMLLGFLGGTSGKEHRCQCRRHKRRGFNPWVRKIPWRRKWQHTPIFLLGESHGQRCWHATVHGVAKSWTWMKRLSMQHTQELDTTLVPRRSSRIISQLWRQVFDNLIPSADLNLLPWIMTDI